jgi:hypothetical protein
MNEWEFRQIFACPETLCKVRNALGEAYFKHLHREVTLPIDILAIIFSFLDLRDIFNFIQVNKTFLKVMTKPEAWKRHVHRGVVNFLPLKYQQFKYLLPLYDAFGGMEIETLKERVGWLFVRGCIGFLSTKNYFVIQRNGSTFTYVVDILVDEKRVFCISHFVEKRKQSESSVYSRPFWIHYVKYKFGVISEAKAYMDDFGLWEGECKPDPEILEPHGKGKWIFDDGTILEGDNVACNGKPVYTISQDEWREYKKLKTQ